jgi:hypothetical protein
VLEPYTRPGKLIEYRRLVRLAAIRAKTLVADIVGHYQDNVWLLAGIPA